MSEIIYDYQQIDFEKPGKAIYEVAFHYDGTWGYALVPLCVINATAGPRQKNVACFGGTHGNEYEGQVSVWRLMHELDPAQISGRVLLIPRLNVPACVSGTRESPADGVNMNRAFPGDPRGSLTYRIAHFVTTQILSRAEVVIDVHAAGLGAHFALCASFHMVKDPQQFREMAQVAALFDTPFVYIYSSEMAGGLLTDQAEAMGKVTIGGEFGHSHGVSPQGVRHAYEGIRNVLRHYGVLPGAVERIAPERATPPRLVEAVHLDQYIPAPASGVYEALQEAGGWVEQGQLVGRLYDFEQVESRPHEIRAPRSGWLIRQPFQVPVAKGDTTIVVAQEVQVASGGAA